MEKKPILTLFTKNGLWSDYQSGIETLDSSYTVPWKYQLSSFKKEPQMNSLTKSAWCWTSWFEKKKKKNATSLISKIISETRLEKPEKPSRLTSEDRAAASLFLTRKLDFNPQVNISQPLYNHHCSGSALTFFYKHLLLASKTGYWLSDLTRLNCF